MATAKQLQHETTLNVIRNPKKQQQSLTEFSRLYINTLVPGFSYYNHKNELVTPHCCAPL